MINTSRITSGFDLELQLGAGWFRTAINLLIESGALSVPGVPILVLDVRISELADWHLEIDIFGLDGPLLAKARLNDSGDQITISFNREDIPNQIIPFGALSNIAGTPALVKCLSDDPAFESVIAVLANLPLNTADQSEVPLDIDELLSQERGNPDNATTFLPKDRHIGFGMGADTYQRFANHLWHTQLRAEDGTHPLPDAEDRKGEWKSVTMTGNEGKLIIKIQGEVPVDLWPDADVTVTLTLTPALTDGKLSFTIESDSNVDTGLLGDLFAFLCGGLAGGLLGFVIAGIIAVGSVIALEVYEYIREGEVQQCVTAKINGEELDSLHCNELGIVQIATPLKKEGFNLSFLDAIPSSIAINTARPENEVLYKRSLLVKSVYQEVAVDSGGFAAAGTSTGEERFQPEVVSLIAATYLDDELISLTFRNEDGEEQQLSKAEVLKRAGEGELKAPFKLFLKPEDVTLRPPEGKLACVCLTPLKIRQKATIVEEIEFENGIRLKVRDAIELQNAAALVVQGYQLVQPRDYRAYYRAKADKELDNNFESLPKFSAASSFYPNQ